MKLKQGGKNVGSAERHKTKGIEKVDDEVDGRQAGEGARIQMMESKVVILYLYLLINGRNGHEGQ